MIELINSAMSDAVVNTDCVQICVIAGEEISNVHVSLYIALSNVTK